MSGLFYYGWLMDMIAQKFGVGNAHMFEGMSQTISYDVRLKLIYEAGGGLYATLLILSCCIVAYLLGSLNFGIIISNLFYRDDVRSHGSGNAGMTNMIRTYGKTAGVCTLAGDAVKAAVSVLLTGALAGEGAAYFAALACILGHVFPIYYKFKGGKGVVVASASIVCLNPITFFILLIVFICVVAVSKYISLGSIIVAFFYPMVLSAFTSTPSLIRTSVSILIAVIVIALHKSNIHRLLNRTENKFSLKSKNKDGETTK